MSRILGVIIALGATVEPALAHAPIKGIGAFYNGMLHPLFVPGHLLALLGIGLLFGQHAPTASRVGWIAFVLALWSALALGQFLGATVPVMLLLLVALAAGLLVALGQPIPGLATTVLAVAAGIGIGIDSMPEPLTRKEALLALGATGVGAVLIVSYIGGITAWLREPWQRIGIRVAGSWTAASALLVLVLVLTEPHAPTSLP